MSDGPIERKVEIQLDEANNIAATAAAMTMEHILGGVHVERRMCFGVQWTETHELLSTANATGTPVELPQVVQQGNLLFQFCEMLPHIAFSGS
jgi:hypothetical protein